MSFHELIFQADAPVPTIVAAIVVLILGFIIGKLAKQFVIQITEATGIRQKVRFGIEKEAKKFGFNVDFIYLFALILKYAIYLVAIFLALRILHIEVGTNTIFIPLISYIPNIISAIVILVIGSAIIEILVDIVKYNLRDKLDEKAQKAGLSNVSTTIANYTRYFLYAIVFITAFLQLGIRAESVMTLLLSVGMLILGTLAILFIISMKDQVPNISSGIHLINNKIIRKGDVLQINNIRGEVEDVTLLTTIVKNKSGVYYIPNAKITNSIFSIIKK